MADLPPIGQPIRQLTYFRLGQVHQQLREVELRISGLEGFAFHDLRHSFGSLLLDAGAPLAYVSEQMGHPDAVITAQIYIHKLAEECRVRQPP